MSDPRRGSIATRARRERRARRFHALRLQLPPREDLDELVAGDRADTLRQITRAGGVPYLGLGAYARGGP